jgi:predicted AlkP superfamily pyrophosphatase or phosphodiesterase
MQNQSYLPNYKNGSIVNLMSSIRKSFGGKSTYQPLKNFDVESISDKNVILLVVDGLGYEYVKKYGKDSFLHKNLKGEMTSVLPATTASAMTSFATGVAPQQHGLTGWFMYLKEIGSVSIILPFSTRVGDFSLAKKVKYEDIYNQKSFFDGLKADSSSLRHKKYSDSAYSLLVSRGARRLAFSSLSDFFRQIESAIKKGKGRKFMLAYWAKFDSICHRKGTDSEEALKHFIQLDKKISKLAKSVRDNNTVIIVTADHGLINTREENKIIKLENHPELAETLSMPLSGEPRFVYCYVKPQKVKQFENYVKTKLKDVCDLHKSAELIQKNYFGLYEPNEKLKDRVGDYTLIMKDNFIMKDRVFGEDQNIFIGNHGGVSREEMLVPLIIINSQS